MISPKLCIKCKGKLLCGMRKCPILEKHSRFKEIKTQVRGTEFSGSSPPSVFVSWHSYPHISIAPLAPSQIMSDASFMDEPDKWYGLPAEKIIAFRESLIRSNKKVNAADAKNPGYDLVEMQELVMSSKPVDVEVSLQKPLQHALSFSDFTAPMGPAAPLQNMHLLENPSIPKKVDYLVGDTDAKSNIALQELYGSGFSVTFLHKLLSAGTLGVKKNRKFVPTRWAITAVDSNLSLQLVEKVKGFQQLGEIQLFSSNYLDNNFYILLMPSAWSFEMLECWLPGGVWTEKAKTFHIAQDHEFYKGRKDYASNIEGAYYSARLAVAEHLAEKKRQAAAVVFREIGEGYNIPLGVWQIRENVRHALQQKPLAFSDLRLALALISKKLKVPLQQYEKKSKLLDALKNQKKLSDFQ